MDSQYHNGADKLAKNTPNAPKLICPSPKVWDFDENKPESFQSSKASQTFQYFEK